MKQLNLWSVLILIASAWFLSAANSEIKIQPNPRHLTENRNGQTGDKQEYAQTTGPLAQHSAPATNAPSSQPTASDTGSGSDQSDNPIWNAISSQVFFNTLLTIATILIAIFNYQLLFLNRPLLVADRPTHRFFTPKEVQQARDEGKVFLLASANCPFRNVGQSPAIILNITAAMKLGKDLPLPPSFSDCKKITAVKDVVVPASTGSDFYAIYEANRVSAEEWKQIAEGTTKILLYGQIIYKGVLWKKYVMSFGFVYEPPDSGFGPGNVFRFGRTEYNTVD